MKVSLTSVLLVASFATLGFAAGLPDVNEQGVGKRSVGLKEFFAENQDLMENPDGHLVWDSDKEKMSVVTPKNQVVSDKIDGSDEEYLNNFFKTADEARGKGDTRARRDVPRVGTSKIRRGQPNPVWPDKRDPWEKRCTVFSYLNRYGGGVRGYSMLIIIQELMHRTYVEIEGRAPRRDQIPKPCDHFDLIVGTGTGGLIAIMLGRLRLNLEQCKELYVEMTRMVFETDKTIAGIPYRSTLFKASMLEHAIKEAVRVHTYSDDEGNDAVTGDLVSPLSTTSRTSAVPGPRRHQSNASTVSFSARSPNQGRSPFRGGSGDPNAKLYDSREDRTKTAVTAMYKGTGRGGEPAVLRSYDSRKEPAPEYDCKIWEAGRATCAVGLAFKPVKIGQSVFHDDGAGTFNPSPFALDEATVNEWPGRDVGVFISVGTGRRPKSTDQNQHVWYEGFMGDYVEARKKLIAKIEGCEVIHERMKKDLLIKRGVNIENYYRYNVEIGVGEFAMNEWHRLGEISTGTRRYLSREVEQRMVQESSTKLAKIHKAKERYNRFSNGSETVAPPPSMGSINAPLAVELPGDMPSFSPSHNRPPSRSSYDSGVDRLSIPGSIPPNTPSPRSSNERFQSPNSHKASSPPQLATIPQYKPPSPTRLSEVTKPPPDDDPDRLMGHAPTPSQYRYASGSDKVAITGADEYSRKQQSDPFTAQQHLPHRIEPPPLPPKTPLPETQSAGGRRPGPPGQAPLPYPMDDDRPPPAVNMAMKPGFRGR
ncbi:Uu.00g099270.m01.CDS01 [Anthostomella pinea]|uniref:Uu.00g099270.m01.CDS01 n=1 Tax=Anthostomella pinea TaxID=933095 RepID=A0AAI8YFC2_9PEZI|nr:Uu.00g099270.m01.CDS01 [Anthostomella pinea]